ncbi:hypothetical protein ATCC90586_003947 [Pythium insidiosum]|nr:hypothetical protein ATCC90586_003947 [Pythium insidiosum]
MALATPTRSLGALSAQGARGETPSLLLGGLKRDGSASRLNGSTAMQSGRLVRASTYRVPDRKHGSNEDVDDDESASVAGEETRSKPQTQTRLQEKKKRKVTKKKDTVLRRTATAPTQTRLRQVHVAEAPVSTMPTTTPAPAPVPDAGGGGGGPTADLKKAAVEPQHSRRHESKARHAFGEMIESDDVVALCVRCGLSKQDVWQLRRAFNSEDTESTNTITLASFFFLINEEKRALTKSLLRLAQLSSPDATRLSFDEFLRCVATFASFTESEVLAFFFEVYATPSETAELLMTEADLQTLTKDLKVAQTAFARNVQVATAKSTRDLQTQRPLLSFAEFEQFSRQHSVAFFPLLQLQRSVREAAGFGEAFWRLRTRERRELELLLAFMRAHHGLLPPLPLKDRLLQGLLGRETATTRRRALAQQLYAAP